jgi:hypothetical protein
MNRRFRRSIIGIRSYFPLSIPIFCAEPRHKRISPAIGARAGGFKGKLRDKTEKYETKDKT